MCSCRARPGKRFIHIKRAQKEFSRYNNSRRVAQVRLLINFENNFTLGRLTMDGFFFHEAYPVSGRADYTNEPYTFLTRRRDAFSR